MAKYIKDNKDSKLLSSYERFTRSKIRGKVVECTVSMVPENISEHRTLFIRVPKLEQNVCLVPGSLKLTAKLKNKNTKSCFLNNIAALLQRELRIKFNNQDVYHNTRESDSLLYKDLWQSKEDRETRVDEGIANENTRKLMSGDDSGSSSGSTQVVNDKFIADTYKDEIVIPLSRIIENQGLYAPYGMDFNIDIEITLPKASDIMKVQASQSVAGYELEDLRLKYKKIANEDLYAMSTLSYSVGRSLPYRYVELYQTNSADWKRGTTSVNLRVNMPRLSMTAIVLLFRDDAEDSESFVFPNISNIRATIEGVPNTLYSGGTGGLTRSGLYDAARDFFLDYEFNTVTPVDFFKGNKFAAVIDMRAVNDKTVVLSGRKILNTQDGLLLEITKEATSKDLTCYVYVVSDAVIDITNKQMTRESY